MGVEEREEIQTKGIKNVFNNIIAENFPNLEKRRNIHIQEAYRTQNYQDQKRNFPMYIIIKTLNIQNKEMILKAEKNKRQVTYKSKSIKIKADFLTQTLNARRSW
jgi:hypothetical protein